VGSLLVVVSTADAQQPATLTFACKGTTTSAGEQSLFRMSIILNFANRTVQGFGSPDLIEIPVRITGVNDVLVTFGGSQKLFENSESSIGGSIDRVTGDLEATQILSDPKTGRTVSTTSYELHCRPAQRMF